MPITLSSSGGIVDDYGGEDGHADTNTATGGGNCTFPNGAVENSSYSDTAVVTPEAGFVSVVSTSVSITSTVDIQLSFSEITSGPLNSEHSNTAATSPFSGSSFSAGSPTITFSGTVGSVFNDVYWQVKNLTTLAETTLTTRTITTSGDESLLLSKQSYVRYSYRVFNVSSVHMRSNGTTSNFSYSILKRIINLWEPYRLNLLDIIQQQKDYRANNYPRKY